ncbi:hypothetical protein ACPVTF_12020 [Geobacillus icigianus]|uniref:Uncharacterized protein n=1 Tax=Geobacillus subterraneus TaxID=129338 RepID=A0A679FLB4_9BACL|nr:MULTISPECIES: hypothetical protein [Geobacillus]KYD25135.1 hypothetical protein B4113_1986 [Geobacillus sp. B4113_201601]BBW95699.1 hypothetical protein GsuE55_05320 [Geobacillus subterraneus]
MKKLLSSVLVISFLIMSFGFSIAEAETRENRDSLTRKSNAYQITYNGVEIIIDSVNNMGTSEKIRIAEQMIDSELLHSSPFFASNNNLVIPQVIPNPGDGTVIGTRYYAFDNDTAKFVSSVLKTGLTAIATAAGYTFGPGAATTIASICTLAGEYINLKPYWTTVKIIRYYSEYYDQYIYDAYHFVYSDSKRTNLKRVYISDDMIKTTGNVLDTF